ncbi:hypothetical protein P7C71_g3522, partial [Lecanoromycetidae sp. Uapishka_2]
MRGSSRLLAPGFAKRSLDELKRFTKIDFMELYPRTFQEIDLRFSAQAMQVGETRIEPPQYSGRVFGI